MEQQKWREFVRCRERLEEELQYSDNLPDFSLRTTWNAYEKAFHALCIELMQRGEEEIFKNRRCSSEIISVLGEYVLQRSNSMSKTQNVIQYVKKKEKKPPSKLLIAFAHGGRMLDFSHFCNEDPETRLATYLDCIKEFRETINEIKMETITEHLIKLVTIDMQLQNVEPDLRQLVLILPEECLEYMEIKIELIKTLHKKWTICIEELPHQLKHIQHYKAFRDNWQSHLKVQTQIPSQQELILLKQLVAKPELKVVRSPEEFWKILDFTYGQDISIIPIQKADLKGVSEETVMLRVLRPEIDPPIATSAVQLCLLKSFKEQRPLFPCVRSCKKVNCDHNVFVHDGIIVEEDATPMGLGMEWNDTLGIIPR